MSYAPFQGDKELRRIVRGSSWYVELAVKPPADVFSGQEVRIRLDSPDGTDVVYIDEPLGTGTGTYEGTIVTVAADGSYVVVSMDSAFTAARQDAAQYKLTVLIGGREFAVYDAPVVTLPGGPLP